jgi:hypothetical protein
MITASALLWGTGAETLPAEKRKPFTLARANALSSALVLLRNGRALRRLALAGGLYMSCITPTSGFRQGIRTLARPNALGWSPAQSSYLDSATFLWSSFSGKFVIPRLLRKYNNKGAFELWSVVVVVASLAVSQSWRPVGASQLRRSVQYIIPALLVTHPWGEVCMNSIRVMVVKQGISVTDAGRGELSAGYEVLTKVCQVLSTLGWAGLFSRFANADPRSALGRARPAIDGAVISPLHYSSLVVVHTEHNARGRLDGSAACG